MKLLIILVTVNVVFKVDGRGYSNDLDSVDTTDNQAQLISEDTEDQSEEHDFLEVSGGNNDHQIKEEKKEHHNILTSATKTDFSISGLDQLLSILDGRFRDLEEDLKALKGCPTGFFKLSDQCFKFFTDSTRSWSASQWKCQNEGLVLAKPFNPLELRSYLVMRYGNKRAWLGAKGIGSSVVWDRDSTTIGTINPIWSLGQPGRFTSTFYCLQFYSDEYDLATYPDTPYSMHSCENPVNYALCEYLMD